MQDGEASDATTRNVIRRAILRAVLALVVLALIDAAWVGYRGLKAKSALESARTAVSAARAAEASGDYDRALQLARSVQAKAAKARHYTGDPIWHFDAHLPLVGRTFTSAEVMSRSVDEVVSRVLPVFTSGFSDLRGGRVRDAQGRVDVDVIGRIGTSLAAADRAAQIAQDRVRAAPSSTWVGSLDTARRDLLDQLAGLTKDLDGFSAAARLAPDMLGAHGPRHYFLAEVNPAEARGIGGLLGTYGIITADRGKLTLSRSGTDADLPDFTRPQGSAGRDFSRIWDPFLAETVWRNAGSSPDFPSDATAWVNMWRARTGQHLDGVLMLDPGAVGALVAATRPITLPDGTTLSGPENLTTYVESTLYAKYPGDADNGQRRVQLVALQQQLFDVLTAGGDATRILRTIGTAAAQRRLLVMSTHPDEQAVLAAQPIGGALPATRTPYLQVTTQNQIGNKIDYYTQRTVRWTAGACGPRGAARESTVDVTLRNTAPASGLPQYVSGSVLAELASRPRGSNHSWVSVYGSIGAVPVSATLDGKAVPVQIETEKGHPLISLYVDATPGQTRRLVVSWRDPSRGSPAPVVLPPSALAPQVSVSVPTCPT